MKQSYTVLFFVLSLAWCNASAQGISSRLSGTRTFSKAPDTKVSRQQTQSITLLQPFMAPLTEVSETFDRIAESNEYVSTPTVEKTLEATTTFTFNADNWITEQLKTYINVIPGSDVTSPKELKYAPTYGHCRAIASYKLIFIMNAPPFRKMPHGRRLHVILQSLILKDGNWRVLIP